MGIFAVMALVGCGAAPSTPAVVPANPGPAPIQTPATAASPIKPAILEDRSLTAEEYATLGMPAHERLWSYVDMTNAAKVLTDIAGRDASQLPRFRSSKSGAVFDRLVSKENLGLLRNKTLPLSVRMPSGLEFLQAANNVNKLYLTGFLQGKVGNDEMTEMTGLVLRMSSMMTELVGEFVPTLDKNDPKYPTRLKGLQQMKAGMGTVMQGVLMQISEPKTWNPETLGRFVGYMDECFPVLIVSVPPSVQKETLSQLRKLSTDPRFIPHKKTFDSMLEKTSRAVDESPAS
jgi:hypothetical protein